MRKLFISLLIALSLQTSPFQAASFDCNKATTETEKAICDDATLSDLDRRLGSIYSYARNVSINLAGTVDLKATQIRWLEARNSCKSDTECLSNKYKLRIEQLAEYDLEALLLNLLAQKRDCLDQAEEGYGSGITNKMLNAAIDYNDCLEGIITQLMSATTVVDEEKIALDFEKLRSGNNGLIYSIYNEKKECTPSCGTMFRLFPEGRYTSKLEDILDTLIEEYKLTFIKYKFSGTLDIVPSATELMVNLPICMFRSSRGPVCPRDEDGRASFRTFSKQNILNMDFSDQEAVIETDDWFYSISDIEADQKGFKFTFTDDAKTGTYLVAEDFFVEWNKDTNGWEIIGHEITYISGADQSNVGKFIEFNEPISLKGI